MFEEIINFFKKLGKTNTEEKTKVSAKERLHLVLTQDRANISADFLALMKQEIIEVIKRYINVDENAIDVRLTNKTNEDGTTGAPTLYANIPVLNVKEEAKHIAKEEKETEPLPEEIAQEVDDIIEQVAEEQAPEIDDAAKEEKQEEAYAKEAEKS